MLISVHPSHRQRRAPQLTGTVPGEGVALAAIDAPITDLCALIGAYAEVGGLLSVDGLAARIRPRIRHPFSWVAQWMSDRQLVHLRTPEFTLLPLFQFEPCLTQLRPGLAAVLAELGDVLDDWDTARWFATPNSCLGGAPPAALLGTDPSGICAAARLDPYVAKGG